MIGKEGGTEGTDNDFAEKSFENIGAWILGRNMFGPIRGPWPDNEWKGWWGDEPPYHVPVFVLTHYEREPLVMKGGTTFYFITDGIESALEKARNAANGKDIRIGGGVSTVRQYLQAVLLMNCIFPCRRFCLEPGKTYFQELICHHSVLPK
jgi:dihydrofolate reductase